MSPLNSIIFVVSLYLCYQAQTFSSFDDSHNTNVGEKGPKPKDKVALKDIKILTFQRNKRTTSRRTHSIHQLSCVGGTAGCKLFTPDVVECENIGYDDVRNKFNWNCHADVSNRVKFNHVEVICEGYDYPEDDYILLGSCGLEFTLDYADPRDYHHNSYFEHMDEHEKELHHERVRASPKPKVADASPKLLDRLMHVFDNQLLIVGFLMFVLASIVILVLYVAGTGKRHNRSRSGKHVPQRGTSYGPLTSAVLTKKAC